MSEQQLVNIIREQLDEEADTSSPKQRIFRTAKKGNNIFAENIGRAVYQYLDTVYYEERIRRLEERISSLEARVK
jgi:hypothetical protein